MLPTLYFSRCSSINPYFICCVWRIRPRLFLKCPSLPSPFPIPSEAALSPPHPDLNGLSPQTPSPRLPATSFSTNEVSWDEYQGPVLPSPPPYPSPSQDGPHSS